MKRFRSDLFIFFIMITAVAVSCSNEDTLPAGGNLPTTYIIIQDSGFNPSTVTKVSGQSFTFVNNTANTHALISDDSTEIVSGPIAPGSSYVVTPDTVNAGEIMISYHCIAHPTARGTIFLTP